MESRLWLLGAALVTLLGTCGPAGAGGRGPLYVTAVHGKVEVKDLPSNRGQVAKVRPGWRSVKPGDPLQGVLLRTGCRSWVHLDRPRVCVDAGSLLRINLDTEASIDVLHGQMSALDGRPGKSLIDDPYGVPRAKRQAARRP
jgi:hypothetical protein